MEESVHKRINSSTFTAILTALTVVNGAIEKITFSLGIIYYAILIVILLITFFQSPIRRLSFSMCIIYFACIMSMTFNTIPPEYRVWERFGLFMIVTTIASPFIQSDFYDTYRLQTFKYIQYLFIIIVILSIPALFSGERSSTGFEGFSSHSMIISSLSSLSIVTLFYLIHSKKLSKKIAYPIICVAFITMLLGASRIAIAGCLSALLYFFYKINRNNVLNFIKISTGIIIILALSYPLWDQFLERIEEKNASINIETGERDLTSSRALIWDQRIKEFKSSPIIGIGFCYAPYIVEFDQATNYIEIADTKSGTIEPGSGWLGIMSMTGLIGLLGFIILWWTLFSGLKHSEKKDIYISSYLGAILVHQSVKMIAEGGVYSAGGIDCFILWITIGAVQAINNKSIKKREFI